MTLTSFFMTKGTFSHGVHPQEAKVTADDPIKRLPFPPEVIVPLAQHIGKPARAVVRKGQEVVRGEPIAECGGFPSVPMHAPATGVVSDIGLTRSVSGDPTEAIFIKPYPGDSQEVRYEKPIDPDTLTREEIIAAVEDAGIVGLGGAAFPTHVKLAIPEDKPVDTVIVNGCECEPYLTTDHRVMVEQVDDIYAGLKLAMRATGASQAVVGIESNKPGAVEAMRAHAPEGLNVRVESLATKYPQGAEKMLTKALLDREVPSGGLPLDVGCAVFNVATLAMIGELVPQGRGLIERVVTVTGPGVERPGNYIIPIGTPLKFVMRHCRLRNNASEIIFGGPMMGFSISHLDIPTTKGITGVLVITDEMTRHHERKQYNCIRCGKCLHACPMHLNPSKMALLARRRRYDELAEEAHLMDCFECGCCSFICPSNIPLVQHFRVAKSIIRERKK